MSDGVVILPPDARPAVERPSDRGNGVSLPARRPDFPTFQSDEIRIDVPGVLSVTVNEDDEPEDDSIPEGFNDNLALVLPDHVLDTIAQEVLDGVEADEQSRSEWYAQYQRGTDLLGLKIEDLKQGSAGQTSDRDPSRANDTTLLEACVKYEASAEGELLPAAGPVKSMTIGKVPDDEEQRAKDFEDDFNYYLTEVATEYYADTPTMLMRQGFCGMGYKKIYYCPIRRRPVSESVSPLDLIVSEEATDLDTALRVTHRIEMSTPILRRMQLIGAYRDVDVGQAQPSTGSPGAAARTAIRRTEGIVPVINGRPQDLPHEIYESDVFLDPDAMHFVERYAPDMPLPYKVTVDKSSRKVLGFYRNWKPGDPLFLKQNMFVKYGFVPGFGFHNWGFMQLLGNQTRTIRSILRLLIAAGMFSNFPGGLKAKNARATTNEIAPQPGEFVDVDLPQGANITKMFMPMPYKEPSAVLVQVMELVKQDAMRLGATVQIEVGEGRTNVPVGTIMAMIEQQIQVMAAVHKRNHRAQKEEFRKLRNLFAEDPEAFSLLVRERTRDPDKPYRMWKAAEEFSDLNIVPASDPNVPSHVHRLLMANVLLMIAQESPQQFDILAVLRNAVTAIGADPDEFVLRPEQMQSGPPPPDPKVVAATIKQQTEQTKQLADAQKNQAQMQLAREKLAVEAAKAAADNRTALAVTHAKVSGDASMPYHEAQANPQPVIP